MAKYCPICKNEPAQDTGICQICYQNSGQMVMLVEKPIPTQPGTFGLHLGDANAISGGINLADSHNIDSHNMYATDSHNVSNVDSHNVITHNVYNTVQHGPKTAAEIQEEKEHKFREIVRKALEDGVITLNEKIAIDKKGTELGISEVKAKEIYNIEYSLVGRRMKSGELSDGQRQIIQAVQVSISENNLNSVKELFPLLEQVNEDTDNGQVQFLYYMLCTFLAPKDFVVSAKENKLAVDNFWRTVWLRVACEREKERPSETLRVKFNQAMAEADGIDDSMDRQYPGNAPLAKSMLYLSEAINTTVDVLRKLKYQAIQEQLTLFRNDNQPFLSDIAGAIESIVSSCPCPTESKFYFNFLKSSTNDQEAMADDACSELFSPLAEIPRMPRISPIPEN